MAERLELNALRKRYDGVPVLDGLSLAVERGACVALLGASGSGKTTALNLVAGLDHPDAGTVVLNGQVLSDAATFVPPHRRRIGMVFQEQLLWPHLSVRAHLEFVLGSLEEELSRAERASRIDAQLHAVQLCGKDARLPAQLSGGEAQRLAIARALIARPEVLLFDEPCANLDTPLKQDLLRLIKTLRAREKFAALYVTHDAAEAFVVADRWAVIESGRLVQEGAAEEICAQPAGPTVARLLGQGVLVPATMVDNGEFAQADSPLGRLPIRLAGSNEGAAGDVMVYVRAHDLVLEAGDAAPLRATVTEVRYDGRGWRLGLRAGETHVSVAVDKKFNVGEVLGLRAARPLLAWQD